MPPEVLSESKCMCCKSQDISSGIMELEKIRFEFGSRIAGGGWQRENMSASEESRQVAASEKRNMRFRPRPRPLRARLF
jgi:hypothetical protein